MSTSSALIDLPAIGKDKDGLHFRPKLWTWGTIKVSFAQDSSFSWLNLTKRGALFWAPFDTDVSAHKYIIHPTAHPPEIETKCAQIYSVETRIGWGPGTDVLTDWLDVRSLHDGPWQWRCASLCLAQRQTGFVFFSEIKFVSTKNLIGHNTHLPISSRRSMDFRMQRREISLNSTLQIIHCQSQYFWCLQCHETAIEAISKLCLWLLFSNSQTRWPDQL